MRIECVGSDLVNQLDIIKIDADLRVALAHAALVMSGHSPSELGKGIELEIDYKPLWSLLREIAEFGESPGQHLRIEQTRVLVLNALVSSR